MLRKEDKTNKKYYIHYNIKKVNNARLKEDLGKAQYKITVKYFIYRGDILADSEEQQTKTVQLSIDKIFKRRKALDVNILNTRKAFVDAFKRAGVHGEMLTQKMREKGFGYERN